MINENSNEKNITISMDTDNAKVFANIEKKIIIYSVKAVIRYEIPINTTLNAK